MQIRKTQESRSAAARPPARRVPARIPKDQPLQRRLDLAERRYRALAETLTLVTYETAMDVQGSFTYISPQVEAWLGYTPAQWLVERGLWLARMHPEDRSRLLPLLARAHKGDRPFAQEYRLLDKSGRARWLRDESRAVRDDAGRVLFVQGTWTDIGALKEAEQHQAGGRRTLESVQAEAAQFVAVASHEMKTPLRRIANLGELLALRCGDRLDEEGRAFLAEMRQAAAAMQQLLSGLAIYGETAPTETPLIRVEMNAVFDGVLARLEKDDADVSRGPLPAVLAEPALLSRVLEHLLDNALKFRGPEAPRVHVSAERAGKQWVISVSDNGIGIAHGQLGRVFSLFERLDSGAGRAGTGLGLAVSLKIVERFGGRIWAESEPGFGSTFRFTLCDAAAGPAR